MSKDKEVDQTTTEIRFVKNRQWHTTYLTILLFAGIIAFFRAGLSMPPKIVGILKVVTYHIILAIMIMGIYFQCDIAKSLTEYRDTLPDNTPELAQSKKRSNRIHTGFLIFLTVIGAIATSIVVYFK